MTAQRVIGVCFSMEQVEEAVRLEALFPTGPIGKGAGNQTTIFRWGFARTRMV